MPTGRPREFDVQEALDSALKVFWRKGFEGASLSDLTEAMGINRPSLYSAFGDKESLFRRAIERYVEGHSSHVAKALAEPTARAVVERLWNGVIELTTSPDNPRGCFLIQGAIACGEEADCLRKEAAKHRARLEAVLRERFTRAVAEGDLPKSAKPVDLAKFSATMSQGLAVQAAGGANRAELRRVAKMALAAWPI